MNNANRLSELESQVRALSAKVRTLTTKLNHLTPKEFPNNIRKGRFTVRRWQNEYPGALMDPRRR